MNKDIREYKLRIRKCGGNCPLFISNTVEVTTDMHACSWQMQVNTCAITKKNLPIKTEEFWFPDDCPLNSLENND